jgi:hypothetical protein
MMRHSDITASSQTEYATQAMRRQQQKEQTLQWISSNALTAFRSAWNEAGLHNNSNPDLDSSGI